MERLFKEAKVFDGDCYVADYTEKTKKCKPEERRKVELSSEPFKDIAYFHLIKQGPGEIPYQAVNLEEYPNVIRGIENCECVFNSLTGDGRRWLMFLETKYCQTANNIDNHRLKAYRQMSDTLGRLKDLGAVRPEGRRIYFVYSVPPYSECEPFYEFSEDQSETLRLLEEQGITLMGYNSMLILTRQYLRRPPQPV